MGINFEIDKILSQINIFKHDLQTELGKIQDNKRINRISPNCYTINSKDLSPDLRLDVKYYDNLQQMKDFQELVESLDNLAAIKKILSDVVTKGKSRNHDFNPDVRSFVEQLL